MVMGSDLPEQMVMEILSRVPAKTLGRCRCVSKPWHTILSTPHFIRWYHHSQNLLLTCTSTSTSTPWSMATISKNDAVPTTNTLLQLPGDNWTRILGSCAGLVLLLNDHKDEFLLVDPITLHHTRVPDSPTLRRPCMSRMHGFGYHNGDHKIVSVSTWLHTEHQIAMSVGVYSLKSGAWKILKKSTRYDASIVYYGHDPGVYCSNGTTMNTIHWLTPRQRFGPPPAILAFDLVHDLFTDIPLPPKAKLEHRVHNQVVTLGGSLCLLEVVDPKYVRTNVWIMKEYGLVESWTKLCAIDIGGACGYDSYAISRLLCLVGDKIALLTTKGTLVSYNIKDGSLSDTIVDPVFKDGVAFVPTLVPPASLSSSP